MKILTGKQVLEVAGGRVWVGGEDEPILTPDQYEALGYFLEGVAKGVWEEL